VGKKREIEELARFGSNVSGIRLYDFPLVNVAERLRFHSELEPFKVK